MIDRIEPGVGAVDRVEERQDVHAAEGPLQRSIEQPLQIAEGPAGEAIDVGNQLRLVLHLPPVDPHAWVQLRAPDVAMRSRSPFTMADSAHPGCSRDESTSKVYLPNDASSGM